MPRRLHGFVVYGAPEGVVAVDYRMVDAVVDLDARGVGEREGIALRIEVLWVVAPLNMSFNGMPSNVSVN